VAVRLRWGPVPQASAGLRIALSIAAAVALKPARPAPAVPPASVGGEAAAFIAVKDGKLIME